MKAYVKVAARSLFASKQRTLLALIGIVIGIASVIALVSIGKIVRNEATKQFIALGTDLVHIRLGEADRDSDLLRDPGLFAQLLTRTPCLTEAAAYTKRSTEVRVEQGSVQIDFIGVDGGFAQVARLPLAAGRFVSRLDGAKFFAVLGAGVPEILNLGGRSEELIGQRISLRDQSFTIVGLLERIPRFELIRTEIDQAIFIPYGASMRIDFNGRIDQLAARRHHEADPGGCQRDVTQYFYRRAPGIRVDVTTAEQLIAQMRKQSDMMAAMLAAIASISLVVGGVGIMNILLVSVSERRQEIGIRRALGASQADIRYQFLTEAVLLALTGGLLGVVLGTGASFAVSRMQGWEYLLAPDTIVLGVGVSVAIGVFFGFFPAHQAARMDPIAALRGE